MFATSSTRPVAREETREHGARRTETEDYGIQLGIRRFQRIGAPSKQTKRLLKQATEQAKAGENVAGRMAVNKFPARAERQSNRTAQEASDH
jgi:hypothetical protein